MLRGDETPRPRRRGDDSVETRVPTRYKDPQRPSVDFASMMAEKEVMAEIEANPKAGDKPGAPGCL